ncbi:MAG: hypothetical protein GY943_21815 [Chloroflexi bacterium]|nr:hypothetical protein [Chloroflexota bacterium]
MKNLVRIIRIYTIFIFFSLTVTACSSGGESNVQEIESDLISIPNEDRILIQTPSIETTPEVVNDNYILFVRDDDLWLANVNGGNVERLTEGEILNWQMDEGDEWRLEAHSRPVQLSPNGQWVVLSSTGNDLVLVNVNDQSLLKLPEPGAPIASWSPDSRHLAYASDSAHLYMYDIENRTVVQLAENDIVSVINIVWSPNSRFIAFGCCFQRTDEGVNVGQIRRVNILEKDMEVVGEMWSSVGGGSPPLCWTNEDEVRQIEAQESKTSHCSYAIYPTTSHNGAQRAFLRPISSEDTYWRGNSLLTVEDAQTGALLWQLKLTENIVKVMWEADGNYLLLDDQKNHSPIWRVPSDGSLMMEVVISDGYLLGVR